MDKEGGQESHAEADEETNAEPSAKSKKSVELTRGRVIPGQGEDTGGDAHGVVG